MNYLDIFLKSYGLNRYRAAQKMNITEARLSQMNSDNFKATTVKTISELAKVTNSKPWNVLHELSDIINNPIFKFVEENNLNDELISQTENFLINYKKKQKDLPKNNIKNIKDLEILLNNTTPS